jgi:predicted transcriptional regulator
VALPKLAKLELEIMEALWRNGASSIREVMDALPKSRRAAYTTVQTTMYRLEAKQVVRRAKKISNAHIFEPLISRGAAQQRLVDDILGAFGGRAQPLMSHLIDSGRLTLDDVKNAEKRLKELAKKGK